MWKGRKWRQKWLDVPSGCLSVNTGQRTFPVVFMLNLGTQEMHNHFIWFGFPSLKFNNYHWLFVAWVFLTFEVHIRCFPTICFTRLDDVLVYGLWNIVGIGWDCMKNIISCWYIKLNLRRISMWNTVKLIERMFEKKAISSFLLLNSTPWTLGKAYSFVKLHFSFMTGILAAIVNCKGAHQNLQFLFLFST